MIRGLECAISDFGFRISDFGFGIADQQWVKDSPSQQGLSTRTLRCIYFRECRAIKEFQRLKEDENDRLKLNWNLQRTLAKVNYHIHTDAIV
jgi:hypothetical protein